MVVQVRGWRIWHVDENHLRIIREDGNVVRVCVADGTIVGNIHLFSRYTESLSEPTYAFLTDTYLKIGDCCVGAVEATRMSMSHHLGQTSMIYRTEENNYG